MQFVKSYVHCTKGAGLALAILVTCIVPTSCAASNPAVQPVSLTLTRAGQPIATIVLAAKPTCAAAFAAAEMQDHIHRITGARLPITSDASPVVGTQILIGESAATRRLGLTSASFHSREYLVRFRPRTLILMGKDKPGPAQLHDSRPTLIPGKFGKALDFDGVQNFLALPRSGFSDQEGTLEAWAWLPASLPVQQGTLFRIESASPWTYHIIGQDKQSRRLFYRVYDGTTVHTLETGSLTPGWHHIAATHSVLSGKIELFVDSASQGIAPYRETHCRSATLYLGASNPSPSNLFAGKLDEVRVSRVVRKETIQTSSTPFVRDSDTMTLLHCDTENTAALGNSLRVDNSALPGFFDERGTLNAVYDFLERDCGVRWYAPTEIGMVYSRRSTLSVHGAEIRRTPAMRYTWITPGPLYMPTESHAIAQREVVLWKLRMRLGGEPYSATHSFSGYAGRFKSAHPDWFSGAQMCYTNPGFIRQVTADADHFFDGSALKAGSVGMGNYYALVPMDNENWGPCAQGRLDPARSPAALFFNGTASAYVWTFVNTVAGKVRALHPDKYLAALAYADYAYPPTGLKLAPNIAVQICLPSRSEWQPATKANDLKLLHDWSQGQGNRPLYLWLYYNFPALDSANGQYQAFPGFYAHSIVQQMKRYRQAGIRGIFMEHSSEVGKSYLQDQLELYVTLKLADDPALNGNALIDEFFTRYYGAASRPMHLLYESMEDVYADPKNYPAGLSSAQTQQIAWGSLGTAARMAGWSRLMTQAVALAATPAEKTRVSNFKAGIWDPMVAGRRAYAR